MYVAYTVTPATADTLPRYQRAVTLDFAARYPALSRIIFVRHGGSSRDYAPVPAPTEIVYVMSSGGQWGRSKDVRRGAALR